MRRKIILNIVPIVFHFYCLILCVFGSFNTGMNVMLIERMANTLIVPIYLVIINYDKEKKIWMNMIKYFLMALIVLTGVGISFFAWWIGDVIRVHRMPLIDAGTILITELHAWCGIINLTVLWIIANIIGALKTLYQKH